MPGSKRDTDRNPLDRPCVIVVGNLSEGYYIVGPFADFDDAAAYAGTNIHDIESWIMTLKKPEKS